MKISIVGTGNMGSILAKHLSNSEHQVIMGSRDPDAKSQIAAEIGNGVVVNTISEAVEKSDIVFLTTPHKHMEETLKATGPMANKIVVDVSNPFVQPDFGLAIGHTTSAAEEIARQIPEAKVVKAFNTVFATVLTKSIHFGSEPVQIFYASDDESAAQEIRKVIESIGLKAINAGKLKSARYIEPMSALLMQIDNNLEEDLQISMSTQSRYKIN